MIKVPIHIGDTILTGKFRNKRTIVKTIGTDEHGSPTVNGRSILNCRIEKLMNKNEPKDTTVKLTKNEIAQVKKYTQQLIESRKPLIESRALKSGVIKKYNFDDYPEAGAMDRLTTSIKAHIEEDIKLFFEDASGDQSISWTLENDFNEETLIFTRKVV